MENRNSLTPFAVILSASSRSVATRPRTRIGSRVLTILLWLVAASTIFTCSAAVPDIERAGRARYGELLERHARSGQQALRVKADAARNRLWVLGLQDVFVYDINAKQAIKRIALPAWSVAGIQCPPDMILDSSGSALISSNAEPRLWKIDAENFSVKEHAIRLLGKENWETGFGALAFAADGSLYALSSFAGSLWRIELAKSSANETKLSERVPKACVLQTPREPVDRAQPKSVTLCAASDKGARRIVVSPDFSRARVSHEQCGD
jgi:hypothetical protein